MEPRSANGTAATLEDTAGLAAFIAEHRDEVARTWLRLLVERSSLDDLAAASLPRRLAELDALLEAAGARMAAGCDPEQEATDQLDRLIAHYDRFGHSCALVAFLVPAGAGPVVGPGTFGSARLDTATLAWSQALRDRVRSVDLVVPAGASTCFVMLPQTAAAAGRAMAGRLLRAAAEELGKPPSDVRLGIACCPEDGTEAADLIALARRQARGAAPGEVETDRRLLQSTA